MKKTNNAVLYFGSYDPDYSRNRIIKKGLAANGLKVRGSQASGLIFVRYVKLLMSFLRVRKQICAIIVGFPGHYDVPLAFLLGKLFGKKVYYDIFASTYETYVIDRKVVNKYSTRAIFFYFIDWIGLKLADNVIIDTKAHGVFYRQLYGLNLKKTILVYVGSDPDYFYPRKLKETTDVLFYGSYQPLQGTDVIIKAAAKIPKIKFKMIGDGQERKSAEHLVKKFKLKNVEFTNWLPISKLSEEITKAKICLGIFGKSQKAEVVIPNKVFDAIASKKTVITSNNKAIREINDLSQKHLVLVEPDNPLKLASKIDIFLKNDEARRKYATNGYLLYKSLFTPKSVVKNLYLNITNE